MSSDDDGAQLMAAFQRKDSRKAVPPTEPSRIASPVEPAEPNQDVEATSKDVEEPRVRRAVCVRVKPVSNRDEYVYYEPAEEVEEIVKEYSRRGDMLYEVKMTGDTKKQVSASSKGSPAESSERGKGALAVVAFPLFSSI
jgi:hypothetical protein